MPVPDTWDQSYVRHAVCTEYCVHIVTAAKVPAEAAYSKIALGDGHTAGYIIPGAAVLSPDNPHSSDPAYCAYNLLVAQAVCEEARGGKYELAGGDCRSATSRNQIFRQGAYYLISWNKYFKSPATFASDFALSLCHNGLVISAADELPTELYAEFDGSGRTLKLKATPALPSYVISILSTLVPYCANPFLKFFYLYQVIEYLMGIDFDAKVSEVRSRFVAAQNPSVVELRDILEKFQDAAREKTRINSALVPACPTTEMFADALLNALKAVDADATFAERIYRVRNILFHDYKQLHDKGAQIATLCRSLFEYLVTKKLLA